MSEVSNSRSRCWRFLWYPDDPTHCNAISLLESGCYSYVAILHDKDTWSDSDDGFDPDLYTAGELKKTHWHGIIRFPQARYRNAVAADLGIKSNYIQECKDYKTACLYLVHDGWNDKFQYSPGELFGNLVPNVLKLLSCDDENDRVREIINLITSSPGIITYSEILRKVCDNGFYGDFRRMGVLATALIKEHNEEFLVDLEFKKKFELDRKSFNEFIVDKDSRFWVVRSKLDKNIKNLED